MTGPLSGIRVIEFEAIGPAPFGAMLLADMGADVIRIDRPQAPADLGIRSDRALVDITGRNRRSVTLDLKRPEASEAAWALIERADVLIEGSRPGAMERRGLGPNEALARNPRLVYGRMTGWGQSGPLAARAGHDLNYIALSGVLSAIGAGAGGKPAVPLNLIGDYGGGGMLLAMGILAALLNARNGGGGQVVDAAMVEGAAQLGAVFWGLLASGDWHEGRASNTLDGGAPWYDCYRTADGHYMAVAPVEERFYAQLLDKLGLADAGLPPQDERHGWPVIRAAFETAFGRRTRDAWEQVFEGHDACVSPVLNFSEAPRHPHHHARGSFTQVDGVTQPMPAPRFSATPSAVPRRSPRRGEHGEAALRDWGFDLPNIAWLQQKGLGFLNLHPQT